MAVHQNPQIPWKISLLCRLWHIVRLGSPHQPHLFSIRIALRCSINLLWPLSHPFSQRTWEIFFFPFHSRSFSKAFILWLEIQSFWKLPFLCKKPPILQELETSTEVLLYHGYLELKGHFGHSLCYGGERAPWPAHSWTVSLNYTDVLFQGTRANMLDMLLYVIIFFHSCSSSCTWYL